MHITTIKEMSKEEFENVLNKTTSIVFNKLVKDGVISDEVKDHYLDTHSVILISVHSVLDRIKSLIFKPNTESSIAYLQIIDDK